MAWPSSSPVPPHAIHGITTLPSFILSTLLGRYPQAYSPGGKLFACRFQEDGDVWVWDTQTSQLCGKAITMPDVHKIALSPVLNDRSLGHWLTALRCHDTNTMALFDACTGHLYAQCWDLVWCMEFIFEMEPSWRPIDAIVQSKSRHSGPCSQAPECYWWIWTYLVRHQE